MGQLSACPFSAVSNKCWLKSLFFVINITSGVHLNVRVMRQRILLRNKVIIKTSSSKEDNESIVCYHGNALALTHCLLD